MGLGDLFKANENQQLKQRIAELESMVTPEMAELSAVRALLESTTREMEDKRRELHEIDQRLQAAKQELIETEDAVLMQEFGLYKPKYAFANSDLYKERLTAIREEQKRMIRDKTAASGNTNWTVNNNKAQGKKMVSDMQKLLIRAFNSECDEVINKVKFNNIEASIKRITASRDAISKLGVIMDISISQRYFDLKIEELYLSYEYQVKKQEEKEEQKQLRAELREQEKLRKEIEAARKKIEKDQQHYKNALLQLQNRMSDATSEEERNTLAGKISEVEAHMESLEQEKASVDYREAHQKAGYVYVISNIGAFGEGVYKIGMTRRLEPMERIDELGDASVPFQFDVHAMIFAEDAPKLENALHHAFEKNKINLVNQRREFFRVSLDDIKRVVKENYDKTVEFVDIPDAEQYRQSLLIRQQQ